MVTSALNPTAQFVNMNILYNEAAKLSYSLKLVTHMGKKLAHAFGQVSMIKF